MKYSTAPVTQNTGYTPSALHLPRVSPKLLGAKLLSPETPPTAYKPKQ